MSLFFLRLFAFDGLKVRYTSQAQGNQMVGESLSYPSGPLGPPTLAPETANGAPGHPSSVCSGRDSRRSESWPGIPSSLSAENHLEGG